MRKTIQQEEKGGTLFCFLCILFVEEGGIMDIIRFESVREPLCPASWKQSVLICGTLRSTTRLAAIDERWLLC